MTENKVGNLGATSGDWHTACSIAQAVFKTAQPYCIFQRIEKIVFQKGFPDAPWPRGRLFGAEGEVRWWVKGGTFQIVVLTEKELPDGMGLRETFEVKDGAEQILWGERKPGWPFWVETAIPRPLNYPVEPLEDGVTGVKLTGFFYRRNAVTCFMRLVGMKVTSGN